VPGHAQDRERERGSASVEVAILLPIIMVLLFAGPQLTMWYFAREAVTAAAQAGARAASLDGAQPGAGPAAANSYLNSLGSGTLTGYTSSEQDSATTVSIHIHAEVPNVIPLPGFSTSVDVSISRDTERFTTPDSP
jgi:Flp pilus assembly protein TadG